MMTVQQASQQIHQRNTFIHFQESWKTLLNHVVNYFYFAFVNSCIEYNELRLASRTITSWLWKIIYSQCRHKPCKAYRELPVSHFSQGKKKSLQGTLCSLQGSCFHYWDFPEKPCISLYRIAVHTNIYIFDE